MKSRCSVNLWCLAASFVYLSNVAHGIEPVDRSEVVAAIERSLPLLEIASAGSADQRTCFTCHNQALPIFALSEARRRGFHVDSVNLQRQLDHTFKHLERGRELYEQGKGQGGGVDTAGYALWSLEEADFPRDGVIHSVTDWLISRQRDDGWWKCTSDRPPTESSDFTTTYLALRALSIFGDADQQEKIDQAFESAASWLSESEPRDTEDAVFRLLAFDYVTVDPSMVDEAIEKLKQSQREDGGWAQLPDMESDPYATATVMHALQQTGNTPNNDPTLTRGLRFLLDHQLEDGSWFVKSRSKPFQLYFESGFPHRADQYISTSATAWASLVMLSTLEPQQAAPIVALPLGDTEPLEFPESDISSRLMQTAHTFVEGQIARANEDREAFTGDDDEAESLRRQLQTILGVVDQRLPSAIEYFGNDENPSIIAQTDRYEVLQVRWPVFREVWGEGLWIRQQGAATARIVLVPDADQTPEELLGLQTTTQDESNQSTSQQTATPIARLLADSGMEILVPAIISRHKLQTDDPRRQRADMTEREWIYRQAFHMGRHVIGYDLARVLSGIDWFASRPDTLPIGVAGYGEGGLIALHAAAIDTRIDAALVSGYFNSSDQAWGEPIYRNVWSRLKHFGNAEVASLVLPRHLIIEHSRFPEITGHKGDVTTPEPKVVEDEFKRMAESDHKATLIGISGPVGPPWSTEAVSAFGDSLNVTIAPISETALKDQRRAAERWMAKRQQRTVDQAEAHVQQLLRQADDARDQAFLYQAAPELNQSRWSTERRHPTLDPTEFIEASKAFRKRFREEAIGTFDEEFVPPNARTRKVAETAAWTAYDVVLDVYEGLFSWGVLVIPNDIQPGQQRPVVVCQHGRNGVPRDTLDAGSTAYNDFAGRLAERGFITYAPHNLYRGEDRYRWLDRKANTIGCTLFSLIVAQHEATLRWLKSLPIVRPDSIAFYGLSYGGETAVRVPPILEDYCLSICSGDFNQWTRKVASTDHAFSFMNTIEWEMPYWNLGNTFDYAEMTYLMFPRPFMVERGHHDRVGQDQWVAHEFAKVRWLYAQFGMADRVQIEFFQGGHSINGEGTFTFLDQWLKEDQPPGDQ